MPSSYNRSDGPPYSRVFPHPAIQHAFPPVSGSVDKQAAFTHPSPHSVQWPPGGSVQKSSSSLDGPSRLSTIYFVSHLKKESENLQLLTYSDPDCTTNCFESINSGKDCLTLRTPNAVFNKVLKHKRGFLNKYAYVVKLDNLSLVRRPKKMTEKFEILQDLCEALILNGEMAVRYGLEGFFEICLSHLPPKVLQIHTDIFYPKLNYTREKILRQSVPRSVDASIYKPNLNFKVRRVWQFRNEIRTFSAFVYHKNNLHFPE